MSGHEFAESALAALSQRGFDKSQLRLMESERHELQAEYNEMSLFRTTRNKQLELTGIVDGRRGSVTLNKLDEAALSDGIEELWQVSQGAEPDGANDIAPGQPRKSFKRGDDAPDYDAMYDRLAELLSHTHEQYPTLTVRSGVVAFVARTEHFLNSNGVDYTSTRSHYTGGAMVSAREDQNVASFNSGSFAMNDLSRPLHECGTLDKVMRQNVEQVVTGQITRKFVGDLLVSPDCVLSLLGFLLTNLANAPLIAGTSVYKDKLGDAVANEKLTLHSRPVSDEIAAGYFVTNDGFEAHDTTIVRNGVLSTYLLDLYGANKTGLARAETGGGCYVIEPGDSSYDEMVSRTDEGILITRFSGGVPSQKGDFSGIAKNSYYISGGELGHPVSETMIAGNLVDLWNSIEEISRERVDFGSQIMPWIRMSGVSVS